MPEKDLPEKETHNYAIINLRTKSSFTEHLLRRTWEQLERDSLVRILFYDGHIHLFDEFYDYMRSPSVMPFVILKDAEIIGLWWLNMFKVIDGERTARIHFTAFRNSIGTRRNAPSFGRKSIRYALSLRDKEGYLVDRILGLTPATYKLALRYNEKAGMQQYGIAENACNLVYENRVVDGILTYATRETMALEEGKLETNLWVE